MKIELRTIMVRNREQYHCYYSRPIEGVNSNLRSPMLNSLREWGERRSTRVYRAKTPRIRGGLYCNISFSEFLKYLLHSNNDIK